MKVSVLMPTYNHENTIAQAIESFLMQECSFACELCIGDDKSTDSTLEIARSYAAKYPSKIKLLAKPKNEGLMANYKSLLDIASGEYIAILESDDYWVDSKKLEKQVLFLDSNLEYGLSFTGWIRDREGVQERFAEEGFIRDFSQKEAYKFIILRNVIRAVTVVFRRSLFNKYCNIEDYINNKFITFDYPVWLSILAHSRVHYLEDCTSVYRELGTSISNTSNLSKRLKFETETYRIRKYIIGLYSSAGLSPMKIKLRESIVLSRIAFRAKRPLRAAYLFFSHIAALK